MYREVNRFANVLKNLGVMKGDRVIIYLPMIPELAISMLACARIGAVHSVVFAGFSSDSIRDRIQDCRAEYVVTADGSWRRGNVLPLKNMVDKAVEQCDCVKDVLVIQRNPGSSFPCHIQEGRDYWNFNK